MHVSFARDSHWQEFQASILHQYAVAKALENIGEAANKISEDTKRSHPEIPWTQIVALRHRIVHDYFSLDLFRIWEIVQHDVPALIEMLEHVVPSEEP